jgi:CMP-N,N'-diacetyllegionaminic acid synthase
MKVLGLIPARGGSKTIPDKNIRPLAGKSLIQRAFECAVASGVLDRIILSTDSIEIARAAHCLGLEVPFMRPSEFAGDDTPMLVVATHALTRLAEEGYAPDALLILQPPSPLRRPWYIREAVRLLEANDSVCSVAPLPKALCPHYLMKVTPEGFLDYFMPDGRGFKRRQDVPQAFFRDGSIFLTRTTLLISQGDFYGQRCVPLMIPYEDALNIDEAADWEEAERRLAEEAGEQPSVTAARQCAPE